MFRLFSVFLILHLFWSCSKQEQAPVFSPSPPPTVSVSQKSYLALGDSYTIGQSVSTQERFPAKLVSILQNAGTGLIDPVYIAQTGWTM